VLYTSRHTQPSIASSTPQSLHRHLWTIRNCCHSHYHLTEYVTVTDLQCSPGRSRYTSFAPMQTHRPPSGDHDRTSSTTSQLPAALDHLLATTRGPRVDIFALRLEGSGARGRCLVFRVRDCEPSLSCMESCRASQRTTVG
jgi:hypothetical protein